MLHLFLSNIALDPCLQSCFMDISDAWASPGTICATFIACGIHGKSKLHVCVEYIFSPSGELICIGLVAFCLFFTFVLGRKRCPVAPDSAIAVLGGIECVLTFFLVIVRFSLFCTHGGMFSLFSFVLFLHL